MSADWYWPHSLERRLFDIALYVGGAGAFEGDEAVRRDSYTHRLHVRLRQPGEPWITPLMELKCVDMRKTAPRPTDLFIVTGALLLSARAHEVLAPLGGAGVRFEPVELTNGETLYWVLAPVVPEALDHARSRLTKMGAKVTHIAQPVVHAEKMPEGAGFVSFDAIYALTAVSGRVAAAIGEADLFGVDLQAIETA